ncbi:HAD-IA family hydrolase [Pseudomonas sp. LPB0260]|uniref:HAD-IA family hydrolase n=1 Tax=Pseudomonas sp. LPB0260 TaxID=2614442 RepID=UPI0015C27AEC|nr:HAD-IA family hydrolase [Pseudomonas sp. LPB0260]QLC74528.1 HAD-IA family hydrolase [Pseudomonas sp. LPB0260]QLC77298.1 HAD-IA family hydrolase [Pseudomonas sp. LPB0260]
MSDYQLLVFDWDGTLVDSIGRIVEAMHRAADACELRRCSDVQVKGIIGLGLPEAIRSLYPELDEPVRVERFRRCYSEQYLLLESEPSALFPGVAEALEAFRVAGYRLAVATGKGRNGLQRVLAQRGWLNYFDATRCADESASKPEPLMLEQILAYCEVSPERALMVGDSAFDLQMARRAGVDSVAVGYGAQPLSVLREHGPKLAIENFMELRSWLERRAAGLIGGVSQYVG